MIESLHCHTVQKQRGNPLLILLILLTVICVHLGVMPTQAQDEASDEASNESSTETSTCTPEVLTQELEGFQTDYPVEAEADADAALSNLFRLAMVYQKLAIDCGYTPTEEELGAMIDNTLALADAGTILAANAVGVDTEAIVTELETITGDSFTGQLLYNGIEEALDGNALGCSGCHVSDTAPPTEGTWTRVVEERLLLPQFDGYTDTHYLVESILHPNYYVVEGFAPNLMPTTYGQRMDIQQLADLVAYLMSQDQLPEEDE